MTMPNPSLSDDEIVRLKELAECCAGDRWTFPASVSGRQVDFLCNCRPQTILSLLGSIEQLGSEVARLTALLRAADKGSPVYAAVERVLDEESAWISRPSKEVTKRVALAAAIACDLVFGAEMRKALDGEDGERARADSAESKLAEVTNLLERFRDFSARNWGKTHTDQGDPTNHHNPIWAKVADALSSTPSPGEDDVERVARAIDPDLWAQIDHTIANYYWSSGTARSNRDASLKRAAKAIAAMSAMPRTQEKSNG